MESNEQPPHDEHFEAQTRHLKELLSAIDKKVLEDIKKEASVQEKIVDFAQNLREKFPDAEEYSAFHILAGSTMSENIAPKAFDFPEPDSVRSFLEHLSKEV